MPQNSRFSGRFHGSAWGLLRYLTLGLWAVGLCASAGSAAAQAQFRAGDRILEPVDSARFSATRGNLHPSARPESDRGPVDPAMRLHRVTMVFSQTAEQQADLRALLGELQDSSSPNYHRWLTPEAFADRFGLSQLDVDKVVSWLQAQGLTVEQVSRSRTWVAFSGTARQVEAALRTSLRRYAVRGETHFAMSREPSVPSALADVVLGFRGLHDFRLKARGIRKVSPRFTSEVSGAHFLAPDDFATIYGLQPLYSGGIDGTGQTIAVVGQSAIDVSDVRTFRSLSGLPVDDPENDPQLVLVPGSPDPGMVEGDIDEAYLDVEWAGAVARRATILYVYSENVLVAFFHVIDEDLAPVLSISYGLCEGGTDGFTEADAGMLAAGAQQANSQGITIVGPSGDSGAADCDHGGATSEQGPAVSLPASLPYVTAVGGTRFNEGSGTYWKPVNDPGNGSALSYIPETTWNDTDALGLAASGGGSSIYFPKPSWQTGTGVPKDGARDLPDVSFNASADHDGYLVCSRDVSTDPPTSTCVVGFRKANGDLTVFGGTSVGVPVFAGMVALINQSTGAPLGQGNVNPRLYALAAASPASFNDITTGNNNVPYQPSTLPDCTPAGTVPIGYAAGAGYDLATGLGSINAFSLVTGWTSVAVPAPGADTSPDFQLSLAVQTLTVQRGGCGTAQVTLTRPNGFAGTPAFTCAAAAILGGVTCSVSPVASASVAPLQGFPEFPWWLLCVVVAAVCFWSCARRVPRLRLQERIGASLRPARMPGLALACLLAMIVGCSRNDNSGPSVGASPSGDTVPTSKYVLTVDAPASGSPGSGTVTVTGTIGGVSRSAQFSLTVD